MKYQHDDFTLPTEDLYPCFICADPSTDLDRLCDECREAEYTEKQGHEEAHTMQTTTNNLTAESLAAFTFHMEQWHAQAETARAYMDEQRRSTRNSEKWNYLDNQAQRWHRYANESASKQNTIGLILYKSGTITSAEIAQAMTDATNKAEKQRPAIIAQIRKDTRGMSDTSK